MSDLLKAWLAEEGGVSVDNVEQAFANGYLWGQLFHRYNLQHDFERFENKRNPDSMVNNYTRLLPVFKRLNIAFDSRTANALMREEPGVALRLLYGVKQSLEQVNKDLEKFKHSGRLGKELGAQQSPNRTLLESLQYKTSKQPYEAGTARFFEENMRHKVPDSSNHLMESMHLRRFSERQYKSEATAAAAADAEQQDMLAARDSLRSTLRSKLSTSRQDKTQKLDRDAAVHAALLKHKEEVEKEELRVELALAEAARRRRGEQQAHAAMDVTRGIDAFEINMKRLLKGDTGDEALTPATTHTPLEHQAKLRAMATSTSKLLEETAGYMAGVRAQRTDDVATKREREARRRRLVVEQGAAAAEAERKAEAEALLAALARQSGEEQRLAARLWQLGQEKEVMRENRELREAQYAERRAADWDDTLRRELELHRSLRAQYESQAAAEMAAWAEARKAEEAAAAAEVREMCEGVAWQLVQLAERAWGYREATGAMVPRGEWRRWMAMFNAGDPALGTPVVKPPPPSDGPTLDELQAQAAVSDWLDCAGEYETEGQPPIGANAALGAIVAELDSICRPKVVPGELPAIQDLPLKLAVVGAPFSGKTSAAQELSKRFKLRVLEPEALIADAIKEADAWTASQAAAPPTPARSATPQPPAEPGAGEGGAEAPQPPRKAALGLQFKAALQDGRDVPDDALVALMVIGMEESRTWVQPPELDPKTGKPKVDPKAAKAAKGAPAEEPQPAQGFVLDGFPRTAAQAQLLEKALTGLDLSTEQAVIADASRVAPPPPEALPQLRRPLLSGLDAVLVLGLSDHAAALKRALGRRRDPATGRVYHLEFDPPPANDPGLAARLKDVADPSNDSLQVQHRLSTHMAVAGALDDWVKRFNRLRRPIDGSGPLAEVLASAGDAASGVLRAKAAVTSCRSAAEAAHKAKAAAEKAAEFAELARGHAEGAARELLNAKKAEIQAAALLDGTADAAAAGGKKDAKAAKGQLPPDPAAVEVLKAQAAAKCAEALKVCRGAATDAAGYAERAATAAATASEAVERARSSLGDAEVSASAETEARAAADDAEKAQAGAADCSRKAEVAKQAAEVAAKEADKFAAAETVAPDAQVQLAPPAESAAAAEPAEATPTEAAKPQQVPVPEPVAAALLAEWRALEANYLRGLQLGFANLAEQHDLAVTHYDGVRNGFKALLARPDDRAALVAKFQAAYNKVDVDALRLKETQAELVLRAEELREALWALCDKKMEDAEAERARVAADTFVPDHVAIMGQYYVSLAQVELDRLYTTLSFARGVANVKYGVLKPPVVEEEGAAAATDITKSPPDLLSGTVPTELKDKLDEKSKTAVVFPAVVTGLAARSAPLALALKVALQSGAAAAAALQPQPEDPKAKGKGGKDAKGVKGSKAAAAAPSEADEDTVAPEVADAIAAEVACVGEREAAILESRLLLLADKAGAAMEGMAGLGTRTVDTLAAWTKSRYQSECSAVAALDRIIKANAVAGRQLPAYLGLTDTGDGKMVAVVDESLAVLPPHPGFPPPKPRERPPPASLLQVQQMGALASVLRDLMPSGFLKLGEMAEVLLKCAGDGTLPDAWRGINTPALLAGLRVFDPTFTGYVDWREVVVSLVAAAFPIICSATCADMADQCEILSEVDGDKDGLLSEGEWYEVEVWFQYRVFQPGSDADPEAQYASEGDREAARRAAYDRATALKQVLWDTFARRDAATRSQRLDIRAMLLYLCADRDQFTGIKKAFSVAAGSISSNARADATQLAKVAYPLGPELGQDIHRSPMSGEELAGVVSQIYTSRGGKADGTPAISAEQLMYSAFGERVVSHLLGRYQWKDLFNIARLNTY